MHPDPHAPDFPAAHSMDTTWFAVDSAGHVAMFETAEMGAVPSSIADPDACLELRDRLYPTVIDHAIKHGLLAPGRHTAAPADHAHTYLAVISSVKHEAADFTQPFPGQPGVQVEVSYYTSREDFQTMHDQGECQGCCRLAEVLYLYEHTDSYEVGVGPYHRSAMPSQPLQIRDLKLQPHDAALVHTFDTTAFAQSPAIQPLETTPCETWGCEEYQTVSGDIRPIDGARERKAAIDEHVRQFKASLQPPKRPWWKFW